jgi:uncharacterized membrane protein
LGEEKLTDSRLKFIDVARSFAIIFMLEGHFIGLTYEDYDILNEAMATHKTSGSFLLDFWYHLRSYTAPLFFTITGLVLGYLLMGHKGEPFWKQKRVSKGWRRGLMIIVWGYVLQLNLRYMYKSGGDFGSNIYTFHVLQCIGTGLLVLIALYGVHHVFKKIKLSLILFIAGVTVFAIYPIINSYGDTSIPQGAPLFIQYMIHSPDYGSVFPIFPNMGYILLGASIGSLMREYSKYIKKVWFPAAFVIGCFLVILIIRGVTMALSSAFELQYEFVGGLWLYKRMMYIIVFIGVLMYAEQFIKIKGKFFIQMGQNTLNIYIVHCMLLYGSLFGFGIKSIYNKNPESGEPLSFGEAALGALIFILFFGVITHFRVQIKNVLLYVPRLISPNLMKP